MPKTAFPVLLQMVVLSAVLYTIQWLGAAVQCMISATKTLLWYFGTRTLCFQGRGGGVPVSNVPAEFSSPWAATSITAHPAPVPGLVTVSGHPVFQIRLNRQCTSHQVIICGAAA